MIITDTHCHLGWKSYQDDLDAVINNAREHNVRRMLTIGTNLENSKQAIEIASQYDGVFAAVGIHPNDVEDTEESDIDEIARLVESQHVVAIGETGLDFYRDRSSREKQELFFRRFIHMAIEKKIALIVHCRDAYEHCSKVLKEEMHPDLRGVIHCYAGSAEEAAEFTKMGFYIAFGGVLTFKNAQDLRDTAITVDLDHLLVETDAPFLAPHPYRGKRNEPAYTAYVVEKLAEMHNLSPQDIARITSKNASDLFNLPAEASKRTIVYQIRDSLYVNLANRCSAHCSFCPIHSDPSVKGHYLGMTQDEEPSAQEVIDAIGDATTYDEIVFCGFGEPMLRWDTLKEIARAVKAQGGMVRVNTNGHGNLIHKRDIIPEMEGLIDSLSISLNAATAETYLKIVRPEFGLETFDAVKKFIIDSQKIVPKVDASIVGLPNLDAQACEELATELGASFKLRIYDNLG